MAWCSRFSPSRIPSLGPTKGSRGRYTSRERRLVTQSSIFFSLFYHRPCTAQFVRVCARGPRPLQRTATAACYSRRGWCSSLLAPSPRFFWVLTSYQKNTRRRIAPEVGGAVIGADAGTGTRTDHRLSYRPQRMWVPQTNFKL